MKETFSYKDPSAFVIKKADGIHRYITEDYKDEYDQLMDSGLYENLIVKGLMISHKEELSSRVIDENIYKTLFPEQINFISYPFEWSFSQWKDMIITYISVNELALQHGMILKDATPYNFTFYNGKCILIDTSSFDNYAEGKPWFAYRQFCEEMLAPFALMYYKTPVWAKLYGTMLSGLPLSFVSKHLPAKSYLNATCLLHIHMHSKFQKGKNDTTSTINNTTNNINKEKLAYLLKNIKKNVINWNHTTSAESIWNNYYEKGIEEKAYLIDKQRVVEGWLRNIQPNTTIDLGANTGLFSFIASSHSKKVISVEFDRECVDLIYRETQKRKVANMVSIVADLVEPSPGLGWANKEKSSLLNRLHGDMVMALALIHHICITKNVPLEFIADLFSNVTSKYVIVEFIPKTDSKVQLLLSRRKDIFKNYSEENFVKAFQKHFFLLEEHQCEKSERKLFLWEKL